MTSGERGRSLERLTALRAFGAAAVFAYHCGYNLRLHIAARLFRMAIRASAFFFVLSGFVLTWSLRTGDSQRTFYRRRFARVYPTYLAATAVAVFVSPGFSAAALTANLAVVQSWFVAWPSQSHLVIFGINPPSWSITCEAFFYLTLPQAMVLRSRITSTWFVRLSVSWALVCATVVFVLSRRQGSPTSVEIAYLFPLVRSGEFLLGCGLCVAMQSGWRPLWRIWHATAVLLVSEALSRTLTLPFPSADVVLLPAFAALIVSAVGADLNAKPGALTRSWLLYLGEISYAFYIVQFPILVEAARHSSRPAEAVVIAGVGTLVSAMVLHHLVELPAQRLIAPRRTNLRGLAD